MQIIEFPGYSQSPHMCDGFPVPTENYSEPCWRHAKARFFITRCMPKVDPRHIDVDGRTSYSAVMCAPRVVQRWAACGVHVRMWRNRKDSLFDKVEVSDIVDALDNSHSDS